MGCERRAVARLSRVACQRSMSKLARLLVASITLTGVGLLGCAPDEAPDVEVDSPIIGGATASTAVQRALGLVTVAGRCSGTLITRDWVLTATHCIPSFPRPYTTSVASVKPDGTTET